MYTLLRFERGSIAHGLAVAVVRRRWLVSGLLVFIWHSESSPAQ
jgi:hypothetical protein